MIARIAGTGAYLPARVLTNDDLARIVDTSDEWIRARTGIRERRIAAEDETTASMGAEAARAALAAAGLSPADIDLVVVATATPDNTFPATAALIQNRLGVRAGAAYDVHAVCSGFLYALTAADNAIARGQARNALVIGAETFSRILDWTDRSTCVLFGDGAGAVALTAAVREEAAPRGVLGSYLRADGRYADLLYVDGGPSTTKTVGHLRMQGNQVFRHAVTNIAEAIEKVCADAGVAIADIDWFVPHQANQRILEAVARRLGLDEGRVVSTVARHGNTSAASVPLALHEAVADGRIKAGDLVLMEAMGGGLTWGAALVRW
ncbi:MAG: ketoacyl-ACP synthase III [Maricaulaceae bacterium]|nr:ketoacyl-ACP synthase III [Maricaulaceae bacterium]